MAINIDIQKQTRLSGLQHPYPRQFQQAGLALAQAGKGLQNIGTDIGNFALAETQALQTTRSKRILADFTAYEISTANELRETASADQFEALYNQNITSWINHTLNGNEQTGAKGLPKGIFKTSVAQALEAQRLTRLRPIASEARLRRLKAEKAGVEDTILSLQQAYAETFLTENATSESTRAGLQLNIEGLIEGMVSANIIDPDDGVAKRQKSSSDLQISQAKFLQRTAPEDAIEYLLSDRSSNIVERVRQEMLKTSESILIRKAAASLREEEKEERNRIRELKTNQNKTYSILIAGASKGNLTATQIAEQLTSQSISGTQGTSLIEFIGKYPDGISDPEQVKNIQKQLLLNPDVLSVEQILGMDGLNRADSVKFAKEKQQIDAEPRETKDFKDGRAMILNIYKQDPDHWADEKEQYKIVAVENYKKLVKEGRTPFLAAVESINNLNIALNKKDSQKSPISVMGRNRLLGRLNFGGDNYVDAAVRLKNNIAAAKQENEGKLPDDQKKFFKQQQILLERIKKLTPLDEQVLPDFSPTNNNGGDTAKEKTEIPIPRKDSEVNTGEQIKTRVEEFSEPIQEQVKEVVQPIQEQAKEFAKPIQEQAKEFVKPIQDVLTAIKESETTGETLNRLANDGLQSLGLLRGPMFALDLSNFTAEDISEELKRLESYVVRKGEDAITKLYKNNLTNKKKELEQTREN